MSFIDYTVDRLTNAAIGTGLQAMLYGKDKGNSGLSQTLRSGINSITGVGGYSGDFFNDLGSNMSKSLYKSAGEGSLDYITRKVGLDTDGIFYKLGKHQFSQGGGYDYKSPEFIKMMKERNRERYFADRLDDFV